MALKPISRIAAGVQASTTLAIDSLFKQMKAEGKDVVGFGAGEPDFPTPEHIKQAGIEAIENNQTKYTPAAGLMDLRKAACYRLKEDCGLDYEPTQIVVAPVRSTRSISRDGAVQPGRRGSLSRRRTGSATPRW